MTASGSRPPRTVRHGVSSAPGLPLGQARRRTPRRRAPTPTGSSTSRSARRSTRRPTSSRTRCGRRPTRPATRTTIGLEATRQAAHRLAGPPPRRDRARPRRRAAGDRLQGAHRLDGAPPRARSGDLIGYPALAYPTYEVGAALAGADSAGHRLAHRRSAPHAAPAVAQQPGQPDRPGAAARPPPQGRRLVPRARHGAGLRRVLHRVRVATARRAAAVGPRPAGQRRLARRHPRRPLALQAVQPRGLPLRLRRRRPRRWSASCSPSARTSASRCPARSSARWSPPSTTTRTSTSSARRTPPGARVLQEALEGAGFRIDHSEASLYLWATRGRGLLARPSAALAERGILVAPGAFYGAAGRQHVRVAFTATDERVAAARPAHRLTWDQARAVSRRRRRARGRGARGSPGRRVSDDGTPVVAATRRPSASRRARSGRRR